MQTLLTVLALLVTSLSVFCAVLCERLRRECAEHEESLRRHIGRIGALEAGFDSLSAQHAKLRGKFYAQLVPPETPRDEHTVDAFDGLTEREKLRKEHAARMIPPGVNRGA